MAGVSGSERTEGEDDLKGSRLHLTFVEFLFSLAAAEVAVRFASVFDDNVDWRSPEFCALVAHLSMALLLIAASYIGWSNSSNAHRDTSRLTTVFSWDFVELMLDVILVIAYFVLVHLSEEPHKGTGSISVSLTPEAFWVTTVFGLYLVWDVVSKFPLRKHPEGSPRAGESYGCKVLAQRGWVSLLLFGLAFWIARDCYDKSATPDRVVAFDVAMVGLVILFRELKNRVTQLTLDKEGGRTAVPLRFLPFVAFFAWRVLVAIVLVSVPWAYIHWHDAIWSSTP